MNNNQIPVFLFNGFLDSGKTTLIKDIIESEEAYGGHNTLIITFEDGEVEYSDFWQEENEVKVVFVKDEDNYTEELFYYELIKKYHPKQVVIELNAFVDFNEIKFPRNFVVYQEITLFDATKFELYFNNMRPLINQLVQYSSLVVFNRCENNENLSRYRRNIRAFNQNTEVAFENAEGKLTTLLNEDLPYDITASKIEINDKDFPLWYLDITECFDKYEGKEITFNGYIRDFTDETLIVGRQIMTCCLDDIQFYGFECITNEKFPNNVLVRVTCTPVKHFSEIANANVIMLKTINIEQLEYVEEQYLEF